jgi:hypothetical protein
MKKLLIFLLMTTVGSLYAQTVAEVQISPLIKGSLFSPEVNAAQKNVIILIAGSGPTNRSGNQIYAVNNSLKFLAEGLVAKGNYVFSYDKRTIANIIAGNTSDADSRFSQFVDDAKDVLRYFNTTKTYDKIIIAGHSEGSLVGIIAAQESADAFISLAGLGRTGDKVLVDQIARQIPAIRAETVAAFDNLRKGEDVTVTHPVLKSFLHKNIQQYMLSYIALDPQAEIRKLTIPVMIINGTKDIQVAVSEAELLKAAKPEAQLHIIANMNHIFKEVTGDEPANKATYNNAKLPVMPQLIDIINDFVKAL